MRDRLFETTMHRTSRQLDRVGVLFCRLALDLRKSRAVDVHAIRFLLNRLEPYDIAFLKRVLGDARVDLSATREGSKPSFFCSVLWTLALDQRWGEPTLRKVEYVLDGSSFTMELDLGLAPECTYYVDDPTPALTRVLRAGGGVFYDIGAHVGLHSLTATMFFDETHAFEPTPATLLRLQRNRELNPEAALRIHPIALSDRDGWAQLRNNPVHPGNNAVLRAAQKDALQVAVRQLDSYREQHALPHPDLVKIDVEGHEHEVLRGAAATIAHSKPTLFVEVGSTERYRRFLADLPPAYEAYVDDGDGTFSRIPETAAVHGALDVLLVHPTRRSGLFDALKASRS